MKKEYIRLVTLVSVLIALGYSGLDEKDAWSFGQVFGGVAMGSVAWIGLKMKSSPITKGSVYYLFTPMLLFLAITVTRNEEGLPVFLTWLGVAVFFLVILRIARIQMMEAAVEAADYSGKAGKRVRRS